MKSYLKVIAVTAALALAATACAGADDGGEGQTGATGASGAVELQKGGTLRAWSDGDVLNAYDPQKL